MDFDQLGENIREQRLALGVVAAPAYGDRSVVFHQGGIPRHREDPLRGIEYVATPTLGIEHMLASSAIPALFPAVRVTKPGPAAGWYYDGGSRLNTPIKPALWLGAKRVIVIALNSVAPSRTPPPEHQPDFYVGAAHLLHAALGDPLAQDIRTLANTNALITAGLTATNGRSRNHRPAARQQQPGGLAEPVQPVPYIFIAPEDPLAIGEIARRVYRKHYRRPWNAGARDLWLLGKILDAGADAMHGELLSYLFFAGEFAEELIQLGQADAQRWIDEHPAGLWQLDPLPAWSQAPNGDPGALSAPQQAPTRALADAGELPASYASRQGELSKSSSAHARPLPPWPLVHAAKIIAGCLPPSAAPRRLLLKHLGCKVPAQQRWSPGRPRLAASANPDRRGAWARAETSVSVRARDWFEHEHFDS